VLDTGSSASVRVQQALSKWRAADHQLRLDHLPTFSTKAPEAFIP
jgi:hypothetical protein